MEVIAKFSKKPSVAAAKKAACRALHEDAKKDPTSRCIPPNAQCSAKIIAKSSLLLCGKLEAEEIFKAKKIKCNWNFDEGQHVPKGSTICLLEGGCRAILAAERSALNFLIVLSGIASFCNRLSEKYGKWRVAATRKTYPGLANSCKRAVSVGGCLTHRISLGDGILIKDNHLAAIAAQDGCTKAEAIKKALSGFSRKEFVQVEVSSMQEALAAVKSGAKAILVDNLPVLQFRKIARAARKENPAIVIEASGRITMQNAGRYLKAGADFVSMSSTVLGTPPADLSLEIESKPKSPFGKALFL
ncbi:MAG: carboxylating nicotinate-nucleotide diphosphorylase [Candidatus Micrarchaeota archaeon]|nr:carboxylating nicotinate-nucleotide diphosphorylase [Candidatus Micrarchaeota archaeon]